MDPEFFVFLFMWIHLALGSLRVEPRQLAFFPFFVRWLAVPNSKREDWSPEIIP